MSFRPLLTRRSIAPAVATIAASGAVLYPSRVLYAEIPDEPNSKKPIYDDDEEIRTPLPSSTGRSGSDTAPVTATSPTPTARLAQQIGKTRLFVYAHVAAAENKLNAYMDSALHLENSFTSTIASLAPPPQSGEKLLPGTLYVLVAAMTGSIMSRNRNILIRGTFPLVVGIGAASILLPVTSRNVGDLIWKYEEKFPVIADTHLRTKQSLQNAYDITKSYRTGAVRAIDQKVGEGREAVEGWVRKGN